MPNLKKGSDFRVNASFYAMLSRMKSINRWGLMRNVHTENLSEHSLEVAFLAHALACIGKVRFGGTVDPDRAAVVAMFHDTSEILTGDLPTPIKYYSPELRDAYRAVEDEATDRLLELLPADLRETYAALYRAPDEDEALRRTVKAADKLSALIKCIEERRMGNLEFEAAERSTRAALEEMRLPEVDCFLSEFLPSYSLTLDEQR